MHQLSVIILVSICIGIASAHGTQRHDVSSGCISAAAKPNCLHRWTDCLSDADCPRYHECCQVGCEWSCFRKTFPSNVKRRVDVSQGVCPQSSDLFTACAFRRGYNCLRDSECRPGQKCCPNGCGSICKQVIRIP